MAVGVRNGRAPEQRAAGGALREGLAGRRVLVVEDEALVALYFADVLEELRCVVVGPAQTLADAMGLARTAPLDAAILDLNLRGQPAWPVADALAERGVPFVIVSGYAGLDLGRPTVAAAVLAKPTDAARLAEGLAACLGGPAP